MSVFHGSALLLTMNFHHNIVKVVCRSTWIMPVDNLTGQDTNRCIKKLMPSCYRSVRSWPIKEPRIPDQSGFIPLFTHDDLSDLRPWVKVIFNIRKNIF